MPWKQELHSKAFKTHVKLSQKRKQNGWLTMSVLASLDIFFPKILFARQREVQRNQTSSSDWEVIIVTDRQLHVCRYVSAYRNTGDISSGFIILRWSVVEVLNIDTFSSTVIDCNVGVFSESLHKRCTATYWNAESLTDKTDKMFVFWLILVTFW